MGPRHTLDQFIARIDFANEHVRQSIHAVILRHTQRHPQTALLPLILASTSDSPNRASIAKGLLHQLEQWEPTLVKQGHIFTRELGRVGTEWHEMWHERLQEASRLFFDQQNIPEFLNCLFPLHNLMLEPETPSEVGFEQSFGAALRTSLGYLRAYEADKDMTHLYAAWKGYYQVFLKLQSVLPNVTTVDLHWSAPRLLQTAEWQLFLPGLESESFLASEAEPVRIVGFNHKLSVINSKQRPRRLEILGSDGRWYKFLLKGHEDLRLDERIQAFFRLVNRTLRSDRRTRLDQLDIVTYSITPLPNRTGLIGWVEHCETFHSMVRNYRMQNHVRVCVCSYRTEGRPFRVPRSC